MQGDIAELEMWSVRKHVDQNSNPGFNLSFIVESLPFPESPSFGLSFKTWLEPGRSPACSSRRRYLPSCEVTCLSLERAEALGAVLPGYGRASSGHVARPSDVARETRLG